MAISFAIKKTLSFPAGTPAAWWKADDSSLSALNDNDPVSSWTSSEGNAYDMTAAGSLRPTYKTSIQNSLPAVRFNGNFIQAGNVGTAHSDRYFTIHAVLSPDGDARQAVFGIVDDPAQSYEAWQTPQGVEVTFRGDQSPDHQPEIAVNGSNNYSNVEWTTLNVWTIVRDGTGTNHYLYLNGVLQTKAKSGQSFNVVQDDLDSFRMGDRQTDGLELPFIGDMFEVLFYESVLSTEEREYNETALMAKWGI